MNELETYKELYLVQKEQVAILKEILEKQRQEIENLKALVDNGEAIIALQKEVIDQFIPPEKKKPHLRLV